MLAGGERFKYASVTERYACRPPYASEVLETLLGLVRDRPRTALDAGCGPGKLARALAPLLDRVDAVDFSEAMLAAGRAAPGGRRSNLRWIHGSVESAPLDPPYALAVAGASFHWFDQGRFLARLAGMLAPRAVLAVLDGDGAWRPPWEDEEIELMIRFIERMRGVRPAWRETDPERTTLVRHERFAGEGAHVTRPVVFEQTIDEYLRCQHSRQTFCLEAMGAELAREFDDALRRILAPHAEGEVLRYRVRTRIEWGRPRA